MNKQAPPQTTEELDAILEQFGAPIIVNAFPPRS